MKRGGAMFLNYKDTARLGVLLLRPGLGRFVKAAFLLVFGERDHAKVSKLDVIL
jgi:hypothetical protein